MENSINLKIELPQDVIKKLESIIIETVTKTIQQHVGDIKTEPKMFTRKEAASALRITLQTLRVYEIQGRLLPKRAGKRVLYKQEDIEAFIGSLRQ
ncbi:MAG: MerR family transcriptional regulator [Bacteroidota bacterium]